MIGKHGNLTYWNQYKSAVILYAALRINLPDLSKYRLSFEAKGVTLPLRTIEGEACGLLQKLPPAPKGKTGWPWTEETSPAVYKSSIVWPKISIVTPAYNQGSFIEETIRAVLLQNYPNLEYIVIDGGSTDQTREILEQYSPWISYWQSEKDRGQSHAINLGFSLASGEYYAWINSDDYYLKDTLLKVISTFLTSKASFVYGYSLNYKDNQFDLIKVLPVFDYFIRMPSLAQPSCFWSAAIHQPIWEDLHCSLDYELWLRLVKGNKRKLIKEPLSVAQVHDAAKTSSPKMKLAWEKDHQLICSTEAHGPVYNWHTMTFFYRGYLKLAKLLSKINLL